MAESKERVIDVLGFSGMNNVKKEENFFSEKGIAEPKVILNADVDTAGSLIARGYSEKVISGTGMNSLWANNLCELVVNDGWLCEVVGTELRQIVQVVGGERLSYVEVDGLVYYSNKYCNGVYDPVSGEASEFGMDVPTAPGLLSAEGSLREGVYNVVLTSVNGNALSGASTPSAINLSTGGILVLGRKSGDVVWCTDANGAVFYRIGEVDKIVKIETTEPCPTLFCSKPPKMSCMTYAFGRLWGAVGNKLYYSNPYRISLFRLNFDVFTFDSEIYMLPKVPTGLYVVMENRTVFLAGTEPDQMRQIDAGSGGVKGTLDYCRNIPELDNILGTQEKGYVDVPLWRSADGIVAGTKTGSLHNVTKTKLLMGKPKEGASLYSNHLGAFKFLTTSKLGNTGSGAQATDEVTCEIFRNGVLI